MRTPNFRLILLLVFQTFTIQNAVSEDATTNATLLEVSEDFVCTQEGNFSIPDSCEEFYQCQKLIDGNFPSIPPITTCPLGTIFDNEAEICQDPSLVTGRPDCMEQEVHAVQTFNCTTYLAEEMAMTVIDTCWIMGNISEYVVLVTSNPPLRSSAKCHEEFNKVVPEYNNILAASRRNVRTWRNGNGIFSDIRRTLMEAKEYGREFVRKYEVNQERRNVHLSVSQDRDAEKINEMEEEIRMLEADIKELEEMLNETSEIAVKAHFEKMVDSMQLRIESKQRMIKETSEISRELEELVTFLELVRDDAVDVENKAGDVVVRLKNFYSNLEKDNFSYTRFFKMANTIITTLKADRDNIQIQIISNGQEVKNLENQKKEKEAVFASLNDATDSKTGEISKHIKEIERKEKIFSEQKLKICPKRTILTSFFSFGFRANRKVNDCDDLQMKFDIALKGHIDYLEALNEGFKKLNQQKLEILSQIEAIVVEMAPYHTHQKQQERMMNLDNEAKKLESMVSDLETLNLETNSVLTLVSEATESLQGVNEIFHEIQSNLSEMINKLNSPQSDLEKQDVIAVVDSDILILKCQLEQFQEIIPEVEGCF